MSKRVTSEVGVAQGLEAATELLDNDWKMVGADPISPRFTTLTYQSPDGDAVRLDIMPKDNEALLTYKPSFAGVLRDGIRK
ncbi:hypothetical protein ACFL2C_02835 [Patescibacteria group bacterium]